MLLKKIVSLRYAMLLLMWFFSTDFSTFSFGSDLAFKVEETRNATMPETIRCVGHNFELEPCLSFKHETDSEKNQPGIPYTTNDYYSAFNSAVEHIFFHYRFQKKIFSPQHIFWC